MASQWRNAAEEYYKKYGKYPSMSGDIKNRIDLSPPPIEESSLFSPQVRSEINQAWRGGSRPLSVLDRQAIARAGNWEIKYGNQSIPKVSPYSATATTATEPMMSSIASSSMRNARILGGVQAGVGLAGGIASAFIMKDDAEKVFAPGIMRQIMSGNLEENRREAAWNLAQYGPGTVSTLAGIGLLVAAPFTAGATAPAAAWFLGGGVGYMAAVGAARTAYSGDKIGTFTSSVALPLATYSASKYVNNAITSKFVSQIAKTNLDERIAVEAAEATEAIDLNKWWNRSWKGIRDPIKDYIIKDGQYIPNPKLGEAEGLERLLPRNWFTTPGRTARTLFNMYGQTAIATKLTSSPMMDPFSKIDRYNKAYSGQDQKSYVDRRLLQTNMLDVMYTGLAERAKQYGGGTEGWKKSLLGMSAQELDMGELAEGPMAWLFPKGLESYYYGKQVLKGRYTQEARSMRGNFPSVSAGDYALAGANAVSTMGLFGTDMAFDIYGMPFLKNLKTGKPIQRFGEYYGNERSMMKNIYAGAYAAMPMRMDTAMGQVPVMAGALTSAIAGSIPFVPDQAAYGLGKIVEGGLIGVEYNKALENRGAALSDPTYSNFYKKAEQAKGLPYAQFLRYQTERIYNERLGNLSSWDRYNLKNTYGKVPHRTDFTIPFTDIGFNANLRVNQLPYDLAVRRGATTTSIPYMYAGMVKSNELTGAWAEPYAVKATAEPYANTMNQAYPFAYSAARESGYEALEDARQAIAFGSSPFGRDVNTNIRTWDLMQYATKASTDSAGNDVRNILHTISRTGRELLYEVEGDAWYPSPTRVVAAKDRSGKWMVNPRKPKELQEYYESRLNNLRKTTDILIAKQAGVSLEKSYAIFPDKTGQATKDLWVELTMDEKAAGGDGDRRKFIPPDPIFVDALETGTPTYGPYSDAMITAAISDSIQEWNWRSPRQGGAPFEGRY